MNKKVLSCVMLIITLGISIFGIVNINNKKCEELCKRCKFM